MSSDGDAKLTMRRRTALIIAAAVFFFGIVGGLLLAKALTPRSLVSRTRDARQDEPAKEEPVATPVAKQVVPMPEEARQVVGLFIRFSGKLEMGINKIDYDRGLADLNGDLQVWLASPLAKRTGDLNNLLSQSVDYLKRGSTIWESKMKEKKGYCSYDLIEMMLATMREANAIREGAVPEEHIRLLSDAPGRKTEWYRWNTYMSVSGGHDVRDNALQAAWLVAAKLIADAHALTTEK